MGPTSSGTRSTRNCLKDMGPEGALPPLAPPPRLSSARLHSTAGNRMVLGTAGNRYSAPQQLTCPPSLIRAGPVACSMLSTGPLLPCLLHSTYMCGDSAHHTQRLFKPLHEGRIAGDPPGWWWWLVVGWPTSTIAIVVVIIAWVVGGSATTWAIALTAGTWHPRQAALGFLVPFTSRSPLQETLLLLLLLYCVLCSPCRGQTMLKARSVLT